MQQLVEGDCGGTNPLVQWTSHFSGDKPLAPGVLNRDRLAELSKNGPAGVIEEEEMVREFLGEPLSRPTMVPQTFDMTSLVNQLETHQQDDLKAWLSEYGHTHQQVRPLEEEKWASEFNNARSNNSNPAVSQWIEEYSGVPISREEQWVQEFQQEQGGPRESDVSRIATELAQTVDDPKIQATKFMDFINKLGNKELKIEGDKVKPDDLSWVNEYFHDDQKDSDGGYWGQLEKEWSDIMRDKADDHPWLKEYNRHKEYKFTDDNPLKDVDNPFDKGLERLSQGDLPSAVLLFEAAVQQEPTNPTYWQYLGATQADNEQELPAIAALEKCLQLDPANLQSMMSLAVSYTNESLQSKVFSVSHIPAGGNFDDFEVHHLLPNIVKTHGHHVVIITIKLSTLACQTLRRWLSTNPKYSSLVPDQPLIPEKPFMHSFMSKEEHEEVVSLYIKAARLYPEAIDSDIQIGLGVLFNLSNEYQKAVDCFNAALQVKPDDAMLWNKLGATLANGNKSDEAIHAYRQALEKAPGFTRCRYNLGISCINLKAYREAVDHFITALDLQRKAETPTGTTTVMSDAIWSTLRLSLMYLGRNDVIKYVDERNLDFLLNEFISH